MNLLNERSDLVACLADVPQEFAWSGPSGVLFVLLAPPIPIEKTDQHAVLIRRYSAGQIAILPEDSAGVISGQRLEFFDGNSAYEMDSPYFSPHKNVGS